MISIWRILKGRTVPSGGRRGQSSPSSARTSRVWRGRHENRSSSSPPRSLPSQCNGRTPRLSTHTLNLLVLFNARSILLRRGIKSSLTNVLRYRSMVRSVFFFRIMSILVSRRTNLTMIGRSCIDRDFCRRWLMQISCSLMCTHMSLVRAITTSLVFSSAVSGTPCKRTFSRRLYWASRSSSNACDCRTENRWPTSFDRRSFSTSMLASS